MAEKEYIEREALEKFVSGIRRNLPLESPDFITRDYMLLNFEQYIHLMPAADVAPVKHGHWIEEYDCGYITPHCSECGETALTKEETSYDYVYSSYCPRCGAKLSKTE